MLRIVLLAFCAALAAAPAVRAGPSYASAAASEARPLGAAQRLERRFLQITAANLRFQAEASQLAVARSGNPAVKDLAHTLLARQQTAQPELLRLLHARGMAQPITGNAQAKVLRQLAKLQGARFDRLYVDEVVLRSYAADIANCEKLAQHGADPVLKAWADRQLPTLRTHAIQAGKVLPAAPALRGQRAV